MVGVVVVFFVALALIRPGSSPAALPTVPGPAADQPQPRREKLAPRFENLIQQWSAAFEVEPAVMKAIIKAESAFDPRAKNPKDPSFGLGQIMPFWFEYFGFPISNVQTPTAADIAMMLDPNTNLHAMARVIDYFQVRGFRFPDQADIYNIGESNWYRMRRNIPYRDRVLGFYKEFIGE